MKYFHVFSDRERKIVQGVSSQLKSLLDHLWFDLICRHLFKRELWGGFFMSAQGWNSFGAVCEGKNGYPESG